MRVTFQAFQSRTKLWLDGNLGDNAGPVMLRPGVSLPDCARSRWAGGHFGGIHRNNDNTKESSANLRQTLRILPNVEEAGKFSLRRV